MAEFNVGDRALYVGDQRPSKIADDVKGYRGKSCVVIDPLQRHPKDWLGVERLCYGVRFEDGKEVWCFHTSLEKPPGRHQKDDLKAADPLFIQSQLPRWLKQEEPKHEKA